MVSSQIRAEARNSLTGKWGKAALLTLVFGVISYIITLLVNLVPMVGGIINLVITPVLTFGFLVSIIKLKRNEEVGYIDFFKNGFNQFGKVWGLIGQTILKMILPVAALIISIVLIAVGGAGAIVSGEGMGFLAVLGIILYVVSLVWLIVKGFSYVLSQYILYDNPDMSAKSIVEKSEELMQGHKWAWFWLPITFIGWFFLGALSFGIGYLWIMPYLQVALVIFYEDLAGNIASKPVEAQPEDNGSISE